MRKKTYIFDDSTLEMIDRLKCELNQKEVAILKEAIRMLYEQNCEKKKNYELLRDIVQRLDHIVKRVEELSLELGRCRERNRYLEEKLRGFINED